MSMTINQFHSTAAFRCLCTPASASGTSSPGALQALCDLPRLRNIFSGGAPEEQASGDTSHGDRGVELCGHAEDAVFHAGRTGPLRKRDAGGGVPEGFDFFLEGVIKLGGHPGASAHSAGLR